MRLLFTMEMTRAPRNLNLEGNRPVGATNGRAIAGSVGCSMAKSCPLMNPGKRIASQQHAPWDVALRHSDPGATSR